MGRALFARFNLVLAVLGMYISSMLSLSSLMHIELPCGIGSGCDVVTQDPRSHLFGLPIAYYGFAGYLLIAIVATMRLIAPSYKPKKLHAIGYGLSAFGLLASLGLTIFSLTSIHAVCTWCIGSAMTMSLLFASHALGAARNETEPRPGHGIDLALVFCLLWASGFGLVLSANSLQAKSGTIEVDKVELDKLPDDELVPPGAHRTGPKSEKSIVLMFGDLTCPVCKHGYEVISSLQRNRGGFQFVFRHLPLKIHPDALPLARLSELAAAKGKFWEFVNYCYEEEWEQVSDVVKQMPRFGVSPAEANQALHDGNEQVEAVLHRDEQMTDLLGLHSTPSCFIVGEDIYPLPTTYSGVAELLDKVEITRNEARNKHKP